MKKKTKRNANITHDYAPGERKKLTQWNREKNHDRKAFPELFDDGLNGLHDPNREIPITIWQNYNSKLFNRNQKFVQDSDFVFVAQQHHERNTFESQVTFTSQRGKHKKMPDGSMKIKTNDVVDVFKNIPGTPAYWKSFRNEVFARMEQLGPFNFFFTLSSAEMKWPEVTCSILHTLGKVISYEDGWEEDESKIKIDNVPLPQYKEENIRNKSAFYQKHYFLITRIFDNKVKAFIKLLMSSGEVANYSYRIEFQIRGMPHVHGVFWLRSDLIRPYLNENGEYLDDKIPDLINKWVSCSLENDDENLNNLVKDVNIHKHTKSCRKGKTNCRFNFPRLPSEKTFIAKPPPEDMTKEKLNPILYGLLEIR